MRVGGGHSAKLSIPRDTVVDIPGYGRNKINAAYALGGPALAVKTVKQYLGIDVDHVIHVNFDELPASSSTRWAASTTRGGCVVSRINGGFRNGGYTLRLQAGTTHIDGKQALALVAHAQEPLQPPRGRADAPAPPAEDRVRDEEPRALARRVPPLALDRLARPRRRSPPTWARRVSAG